MSNNIQIQRVKGGNIFPEGTSAQCGLTRDVATQIISEVATAVKDWRTLATKLAIASSEMERFGSTFFSRIKDFS